MEIGSLVDMAKVDICTVKKETLVDIKNVEIDAEKDRSQRISDFVKQIKNPYCFLCNGVIVKISFSQTEETLEDKLNGYFLSL